MRYPPTMSEVSGDLHRKAEACRQLANLSKDTKRKVHWIERATEWDRLAVEADHTSKLM
jgi:hypothetical protein